jgi:hypothetical protein
MEASGTIGKTLTFAKWKGRAYVRNRVTPANPQSAAQSGIRSMMAFLGNAWAAISAPAKASYEAGATAKAISPFNEFMSVNMGLWRDGDIPSHETPAAQAQTPATVTDLTLTGGAGYANVSATVSTVTNQWGVIVFRDDATITVTNRTTAIHVIPIVGDTTVEWIDSDLVAGTYHYRVAAITEDGLMGTVIADENVVVT